MRNEENFGQLFQRWTPKYICRLKFQRLQFPFHFKAIYELSNQISKGPLGGLCREDF